MADEPKASRPGAHGVDRQHRPADGCVGDRQCEAAAEPRDAVRPFGAVCSQQRGGIGVRGGRPERPLPLGSAAHRDEDAGLGSRVLGPGGKKRAVRPFGPAGAGIAAGRPELIRIERNCAVATEDAVHAGNGRLFAGLGKAGILAGQAAQTCYAVRRSRGCVGYPSAQPDAQEPRQE
jgi:hypothetical protein